MLFDTIRSQHQEHKAAVAHWQELRKQLPASPSRAAGGLTICSVAYKAKDCLDTNYELMRALNPGIDLPTWLLFDNNDRPEERVGADPRFDVIRPVARMGTMGYEHALGLATMLSHIRTRYVLFLDPDCFIVRPNWVHDVPHHMEQNGLGFFGTPINPRRHNSYRYFPYIVCMFVDLARVPLRDLCFIPDVWEWKTSVTYALRRGLATVPKVGLLFRWLLTEQWLTNAWRIKEQYGRGDRVKFECTQPVWDVNDTIPPRSVKRLINNLTPASVAPVPKQAGYCSVEGFRDLGGPDVARYGWEEFVWQRRPFAFHIGSVHLKPGQYEAMLEDTVREVGATLNGAAVR